jgi:hypothetical protein
MLTLSTETKTEIIRGLPFADYCQIPALNQSLAKSFSPDYDGCPRLYRYRSLTPDNRDSGALRAGRAFHSRLLEPKQFAKSYRVMTPEECEAIFENMQFAGGRSKSKAKYMTFASFADWKAAGPTIGFTTSKSYKEWMEGDSREVLSVEDAEMLSQMSVAIWENRDVSEAIDGASLEDCEVTAQVPHSFRDGGKIQLKARFDIVTPDAIIDAKTCRSTNARRFAYDARRYGYDLQAAWYLYVAKLAGMERKRFGFLAQEKTAPYLNCIHWMPEGWVSYATQAMKTLLSEITEAIEMDRWPNPDSGELEPPADIQKIIEEHF